LEAGTESLAPPLNANLSLKLYPNPANGWTTLHFKLTQPQTVEAVFIDCEGRMVFSMRVDFEAGEDIAWRRDQELPTGVYVVRLYTDSYIMTNKLVWMK